MFVLVNWVGGIATFITLIMGFWIMVESIRKLAGWKVDAEVAALRRRLFDVEAIRGAERDIYRSRSIIRDHIGEPPYPRPVCDETEGDCA
jgi:hypothetical protein